MRPGFRWLAYWLVVVGCFAFVVYVLVDSRAGRTDAGSGGPAVPQSTLAASPTPGASPTPSPTGQRPSALFVGDSYQAGGGGVAKRDTLAHLVCARLDWSCRYDAVRGSGYLASPSYGRRLSAGGDEPDVVVVTSGRADLGLSGVGSAVTRYLKDLAQRFPDARIVVVEPFWNDDLNSFAMTRLRADVRSAARSGDATWVPSKGWIETSMLAPGGLQLTADGHRRLAGKLAGKLRTALPGR